MKLLRTDLSPSVGAPTIMASETIRNGRTHLLAMRPAIPRVLGSFSGTIRIDIVYTARSIETPKVDFNERDLRSHDPGDYEKRHFWRNAITPQTIASQRITPLD